MRLTRPAWIVLLAIVFLCAFGLRVAAIKKTPRFDHHVDLEIYRSGGALVVNGVNPYDYSDNLALRASLHRGAQDPVLLGVDQARWDYYAGSNLPMNVLFFAGMSAMSDDPRLYRYAFAFFDSVLAALIVWFVIRCWGTMPAAEGSFPHSQRESAEYVPIWRLAVGLVLGCFSPVTLKWAGVLPEDKDIEVLLLMAAIVCCLSLSFRVWYWMGALFLGLAIAFKGLGIFLVPMFAQRLLKLERARWMRLLVFAVLVGLFVIVWALPFWQGIVKMVSNRLLLASSLEPQHSSMWIFAYARFAGGWKIFRLGTVFILGAVSLLGYWRKRIGLDVVCATFLLMFVCVWLINGSMDRQNIALLPALLVLGMRSVRMALICALPYLLGGVAGFISRSPVNEVREATGVLLFVVTYLAALCWLSFSRQGTQSLRREASVRA
ncbi:MAG TPA: hypothetical protein VKZ53_12840 [Candidatus Angelobacter sp.]|nr:hypothetical protein [Candidatus Angelobacter sp.]